jgi:hypothetical protein
VAAEKRCVVLASFRFLGPLAPPADPVCGNLWAVPYRRVVPNPGREDYRWCSARWFEASAEPSFQRTVATFKTDRLYLRDDFEVVALDSRPPHPPQSGGKPPHLYVASLKTSSAGYAPPPRQRLRASIARGPANDLSKGARVRRSRHSDGSTRSARVA